MRNLFLALILTTPFLAYSSPQCVEHFKTRPVTLLSLSEVQNAYVQMDRLSDSISRVEYTKGELDYRLNEVRFELTNLKKSFFFRIHKWTGKIANLERQIKDLEEQVVAFDQRQRNEELERDSAQATIIQQNLLARELSSRFEGYSLIEASLRKALLKNPEEVSRKFEIDNTVENPNLEKATIDGSMIVKELDSRKGIALLKSNLKIDLFGTYSVDFFAFYDFRNQKVLLSGFEVDSKNVFSQFFMDPASLYKGPVSVTNYENLPSQSGQLRPQDFNKTAARLKSLSPTLTSEQIGTTLRAYQNNPTVHRQMDYVLPLLETKASADLARANRRSYRKSYESSSQASSQSSMDFWIFYWILISNNKHPEYHVKDQTLMQISLVPEAERNTYLQSAAEKDSLNVENQSRYELQLEQALSDRLEMQQGQTVEQMIERPFDTPSRDVPSYTRESEPTRDPYDSGSNRDSDYSRDESSTSSSNYDSSPASTDYSSSSDSGGGGSFGGD